MDVFSLPYDLRIGVTGHRNLDGYQAVEDAVAGLLDHLQAVLDDQGQTPLRWMAFSALARGADRVVAKAVLRRSNSRVTAVLPFAASEYRNDFKEPADLEEFERLLGQASEVVTLQNIDDEADQEGAETNAISAGKIRNKGYLAAGQWVVDNCEILIAIWDGEPSRGMGGTAEVVEYALDQKKTVLWIDAKNPSVAVVRLRESGQGGTFPPQTSPLPDAIESLSPGFAELTEYNRPGVIAADELLSALKQEEEALYRSMREIGLDAGLLKPAIDQLLPRYVRADRLALRYQRRYLFAGRGLFYLAAMAVTLAVTQEVFFREQMWLSLLEFAAMAAAWLLHTSSRRRGDHEKWLRNRYIAERIRNGVFTVLVEEFPVPRSSQGDTPLPFYPGPQNWLVASLDRMIADTRQTIPAGIPFQLLKQFIVRKWIVDQRDWHDRNANRKTRSARRLRVAGTGLFFLTMVLVFLHIVNFGSHSATAPWLSLGKGIVFLAIVLPAWGAAAHAIATLLEFERIATRSRRMSQALTVIARQADLATGSNSLRAAVREAAKVIGIENHEWWILLSFRELVLV
jgi:hypothetical protein